MYRSICHLALVCLLCLGPLGAVGQENGQPVVVEADEALEWRRAEGAYIARGNARAAQGDLVVEADRLVAYEAQNGGGEAAGGARLARMAAEGAVRITLPDAAATGARADYDIEAGLIVLRGDDLRLTTDGTVITARDTLEYWQDKRLVVARGAARAVRGDDRIDADVLSAVLARTDGDGGDQALESVQGRGNVVLRTGGDVVRGDQATYAPQEETAVVTGDVRISRGEDVLTGGRAEVDFEAGTGRLLGGAQGSADGGRVKALFRVRDRDAGGS